jgi:hypothetical protein
MLLALVACGPARHTTSPTWTTTVSTTTLADSVWVFSQTYPDGFTLSINTWEQPKEGITVAYSATQDRHDRADLDFVVSHARAHDGYIGGWLDTATGRFYYDSVRLFPEDALEEAVKFGRENGQIAIFILSSSTEIRLEEY